MKNSIIVIFSALLIVIPILSLHAEENHPSNNTSKVEHSNPAPHPQQPSHSEGQPHEVQHAAPYEPHGQPYEHDHGHEYDHGYRPDYDSTIIIPYVNPCIIQLPPTYEPPYYGAQWVCDTNRGWYWR
jgi:hypothetical protein